MNKRYAFLIVSCFCLTLFFAAIPFKNTKASTTACEIQYSSDGKYDSSLALRIAAIDDATAGECARGVANILEAEGYQVTRGDAYTWAQNLLKDGWVLVPGATAATAPEGAVIVYDRDNPPGGSGGAKYGHVEIVTYDNGQRVYVSDAARKTPGGTVPDNFMGVYVYKGK